VTCGGLCPGLNDVIRSLVRNLTYHYGVPRVVDCLERLGISILFVVGGDGTMRGAMWSP
jgi:6-phosphofructokinase 1